MDFETKLAAAGETLEKMAAERGLTLADFTEQETVDILATIMGEDVETKTASETPAPAAPSAPAPAAPAAAPEKTASAQLTYGQVMAEVVKVASANGYDITKASPAEIDDAVQKMAALLSNPEYMAKQAAMQEKIAEADAMGRVMAHAYVDELGKIAGAKQAEDEKKKEEEEKEKHEKKASLIRDFIRSKTAGEMPEAFKAHMKGKDKGDKHDEHEKHESKEHEKEEHEKEAFAKQASLLAAEKLILAGVNPATGAKFASAQEQLDAASDLILKQRGYL